MNSSSRLPKLLRLVAAFVFVATLATWLGTGAHRGWTRTSVTEMQHDEVTGIDFPVTHTKFVAGVDVLGLGLALAGALGASSLLVTRLGASMSTEL